MGYSSSSIMFNSKLELKGAQRAVTDISQAETQAKNNQKFKDRELKIDRAGFKDVGKINDRCMIRIKKVLEFIIVCFIKLGNNDSGFA
ncbi:unnamed protein product [Arctia plantaginis]|uniref:Uncharacterized protein n=1 Tax=Arctia plantaginis TaxID=874455 RepID=A0A8S0YMZ2_ARCPL|nr:unnamed protein product [Arctia plantaginis]